MVQIGAGPARFGPARSHANRRRFTHRCWLQLRGAWARLGKFKQPVGQDTALQLAELQEILRSQDNQKVTSTAESGVISDKELRQLLDRSEDGQASLQRAPQEGSSSLLMRTPLCGVARRWWFRYCAALVLLLAASVPIPSERHHLQSPGRASPRRQ